MAKDGDIIACQVVALEPDRPTEFGRGYYAGTVTVKLLEGKHERDHVIMVNGSVQNVPLEDRVIGRVGEVYWGQYGSYNGWLWRKKR